METEMNFTCSDLAKMISTEEFARAIKCEPASIRKRFSVTGSYFGIRPHKLPNRRLLWPANAIELLIKD